MVCAGVIVSAATVRARRCSRPRSHLHSYAQVEASVLFSGVEVGRGAVVRNAILDKNVLRRARRRGSASTSTPIGRRASPSRTPGWWSIGKGARVRARVTADVSLRVALLTREYPPEVYGGAGVHVEYLARELPRRVDARPCTAGERHRADPAVHAPSPVGGAGRRRAASRRAAGDVHRPGHGRRGRGSRRRPQPHLVRPPRRPPGQAHLRHPARGDGALARAAAALEGASSCGGGYALSSFCEQTALEEADAVIAVSEGIAARHPAPTPTCEPERVHVIYNGIDTAEYRPDRGDRRARALRRRPEPTHRCCSSAGSPARRASSTCSAPRSDDRPVRPGGAVRRRPGHPGDRRRDGGRPCADAQRAAAAASSGSRRCCPATT